MTLLELQQEVFASANPDVINTNPDFAIFKRWLVDKKGTPLRGSPAGQETILDDGTSAQVFVTGQIALYDPKTGIVSVV